MRLTPWRALRPKDANSGLDKERLEERLAKLVGGPVAGATPVPAPPVEAIVPDPGNPAEVGAVLEAVALPVMSQKRGDDGDTATSERIRRRRRKAGFLLFFAGLIAVFFMVRAIPADWEIGPSRIDASGSAGDPEASLYFADDPHAPFWLLVPTFNLPPRFFAARPKPSSQPVALGPTATPSPSGTATPTASPTVTPSPPASASPSRSPNPSPSTSTAASPTAITP